MKADTNRKLMVGIFICFAFGILFIAVHFLGKKARLFSSTIKLHTVYRNINGLKAGSNVRFSGIDVGTVDNVVITTDTTVRVDFLIDKQIKKFIKKGATSSINSDGLMGDKILVITTGDPLQPEVSNGDYIAEGPGNNVDAILAQAKTAMTNVAKITGDIAVISDSIKNGKGTLGKILMDPKFARGVESTLRNANEGVEGFKEDMKAAQSNVLLKGYFKHKAEKAKKDSIEAVKKQ